MEKTVQYKINKISQVEYWINPKSDLVITDHGCDVTMNLSLTLLRETQEVNLTVSVQYYEKTTGEELSRFAAEFFFHVLDYDAAFNFQSGKMNIPDGFLLDANAIAVGSVRGMLVLLNKGSFLENVYLPIFNPLELLNSFKAQQTRTEDQQAT